VIARPGRPETSLRHCMPVILWRPLSIKLCHVHLRTFFLSRVVRVSLLLDVTRRNAKCTNLAPRYERNKTSIDIRNTDKDRFPAQENKTGSSIVCCVAIDYEPNGLVFESWHRPEIFPFSKTSRPGPGPTKPPIQ
jgi:hypothetical protein